MTVKLKNKGGIPQGMLAPSGYHQTPVDPAVQATTRPPGSLLAASPGYEGAIRPFKNLFQGAGSTGGFRDLTFAEDVGGTGAALSLVPGNVSQIADSEWLPTDEGDIVEGSVIIADRGEKRRFAHILHEAERVIPDMGDRHPERPLSRWMRHPGQALRQDYRENPAMTVLAAGAAVYLLWAVTNDLERQYRSRRGRGIAAKAEAVPTSAAATGTDEIDKVTKAIGDAAETAVSKISKAVDTGVGAIEDAAKTVTE